MAPSLISKSERIPELKFKWGAEFKEKQILLSMKHFWLQIRMDLSAILTKNFSLSLFNSDEIDKITLRDLIMHIRNE